jgi:hypothetical protein
LLLEVGIALRGALIIITENFWSKTVMLNLQEKQKDGEVEKTRLNREKAYQSGDQEWKMRRQGRRSDRMK